MYIGSHYNPEGAVFKVPHDLLPRPTFIERSPLLYNNDPRSSFDQKNHHKQRQVIQRIPRERIIKQP